MSQRLWPLAASAALIAVMYLTCVRPMRRRSGSDTTHAGIEAKRRAELAALRVEVAELRHHMPQPASSTAPDITGAHHQRDTTAALR